MSIIGLIDVGLPSPMEVIASALEEEACVSVTELIAQRLATCLRLMGDDDGRSVGVILLIDGHLAWGSCEPYLESAGPDGTAEALGAAPAVPPVPAEAACDG